MKKITSALAIVILLCIACTKQDSQPLKTSSDLSVQNTQSNLTSHFIGERFGGGVIFMLNKAKDHGLISDSIDLGLTGYNDVSNIITGASATAIGTGFANTRTIKAVQGNTDQYAALLCLESTRGGFNDWFLPSKDELNALFLHRKMVGGFVRSAYWSSSETYGQGYGTAWSQDFIRGTQDPYSSKQGWYYVRAIRAF